MQKGIHGQCLITTLTKVLVFFESTWLTKRMLPMLENATTQRQRFIKLQPIHLQVSLNSYAEF
jgi:hypothetical protein